MGEDPQKLPHQGSRPIPNQSLELVVADGSALKTHGTMLLTLQLNRINIPVYVAVASPLTTEGVY